MRGKARNAEELRARKDQLSSPAWLITRQHDRALSTLRWEFKAILPPPPKRQGRFLSRISNATKSIIYVSLLVAIWKKKKKKKKGIHCIYTAHAYPLHLEQKCHLNHSKQKLQSIPEILIGYNTLNKCCQNIKKPRWTPRASVGSKYNLAQDKNLHKQQNKALHIFSLTKRITQGFYEDIYTSIDKLYSSNMPTHVTAVHMAAIPSGIAFQYQEKKRCFTRDTGLTRQEGQRCCSNVRTALLHPAMLISSMPQSQGQYWE